MIATPDMQGDDEEVGDDLVLTKPEPRGIGGGAWIRGTLNGHQFSALVFKEHATNEGWELDKSRISKLSVQREDDPKLLFSWDRGLDIPAENSLVLEIVAFLCEGLAEHVYGE